MQKRHIPFLAAAVLSLSATCVQAGESTATFGTGHAADSRETASSTMMQPARAEGGVSLSALIGTGHAAQREPLTPSGRSSQPAAPHWTSWIGTGHAMDSGLDKSGG